MLAGAGTGKTRVFTARIAHILAGPARPIEILAVTFTNKAAREMQRRIGTLTGQARRHALAGHVSRHWRENTAPPRRTRRPESNFTILDTDDQLRLIKQVLTAENIDEKRWTARTLAGSNRLLEKPGPDPDMSPRWRSGGLRQRHGRRLYTSRTRSG